MMLFFCFFGFVFIAIRFPDRIKKALSYLQQDLRDCGMKGNYTREENFHLTLVFIGEYKNPEVVMDALEGIDFKEFNIELDGFGNFGDLYWAGIKDNGELGNIVKRIRHVLADNGIPFDKKRFSPHITVLRKAAFTGNPDSFQIYVPDEGMKVDSISLMRSDRGKKDMIYTEIGCIPCYN
ncbi:MAG: RNA 2',3'-cyclic phosphodiesterase [Lachnospiraceae bacterium]|nr:RNA 2',3'-cyclic phosphodiesterase [Lachnospiraceae bacterium]